MHCTDTAESFAYVHVTLNIHEMDSLYTFIVYYKYTKISCCLLMCPLINLAEIDSIYNNKYKRIKRETVNLYKTQIELTTQKSAHTIYTCAHSGIFWIHKYSYIITIFIIIKVDWSSCCWKDLI